MGEHTGLPWFVSGVRFRMNCRDWISINRYDDSKKQDENIACVGYDPRTGLGQQDAAFIVTAVNNHDALVKALKESRAALVALMDAVQASQKMNGREYVGLGIQVNDAIGRAWNVLASVGGMP